MGEKDLLKLNQVMGTMAMGMDMDMVIVMATMDTMARDQLMLSQDMVTMVMDMDMDMDIMVLDMDMVMDTMDEHKARISSKSSKMKWILLNLVKINTNNDYSDKNK